MEDALEVAASALSAHLAEDYDSLDREGVARDVIAALSGHPDTPDSARAWLATLLEAHPEPPSISLDEYMTRLASAYRAL